MQVYAEWVLWLIPLKVFKSRRVLKQEIFCLEVMAFSICIFMCDLHSYVIVCLSVSLLGFVCLFAFFLIPIHASVLPCCITFFVFISTTNITIFGNLCWRWGSRMKCWWSHLNAEVSPCSRRRETSSQPNSQTGHWSPVQETRQVTVSGTRPGTGEHQAARHDCVLTWPLPLSSSTQTLNIVRSSGVARDCTLGTSGYLT